MVCCILFSSIEAGSFVVLYCGGKHGYHCKNGIFTSFDHLALGISQSGKIGHSATGGVKEPTSFAIYATSSKFCFIPQVVC
jgi:hypothetical protein